MMARRMMRKHHVRCRAGEKVEITSKPYLSLYQISYVYDKNYQQVKATDAKGNTITYKYDSMGRVIEESNKDFGTKLYEYDKAGNLKKIYRWKWKCNRIQVCIRLGQCFSPKMQLVI